MAKTTNNKIDWRAYYMNEDVRRQAATLLSSLLLGSVATGALIRTGSGLGRMLREKPISTDLTPHGRRVELLLPQQQSQEEEEEKQADESGWKKPIDDLLYNTFFHLTPNQWQNDLVRGGLAGSGASSPFTVPAFLALGIPGAVAGAYGGWKLTDIILDALRKNEKKKQLEQAKKKYHETVMRQFQQKEATEQVAAASDQLLDQLFDRYMQKQAQGRRESAVWRGTKNVASGGAGLALAYIILGSLLTGGLTYEAMRKRREDDTTQRAIIARTRQRYGGLPPAYVVPTPKVLPAPEPLKDQEQDE